jgi:hypothetical protein
MLSIAIESCTQSDGGTWLTNGILAHGKNLSRDRDHRGLSTVTRCFRSMRTSAVKNMTCIALILILTACNFPVQEREAERDFTVAPMAEDSTTEVEATFTPMPEHEAAAANVPLTPPPGRQECAWKWNSQSLTDLSAELQAALVAAGLTESTGKASAFGEDCIDPKTESVSYFVAKQTEFRITLPVEDLSDLDALGGYLKQVLMALELFPPEATPGPMAGKVDIVFDARGEQEMFSFTQEEGTIALKDGFSGAVLLEALGYRP